MGLRRRARRLGRLLVPIFISGFARADTLTSPQRLREELPRLAAAGCTDLVLFPCSGGLEQVALLAEAVDLPPVA